VAHRHGEARGFFLEWHSGARLPRYFETLGLGKERVCVRDWLSQEALLCRKLQELKISSPRWRYFVPVDAVTAVFCPLLDATVAYLGDDGRRKNFTLGIRDLFKRFRNKKLLEWFERACGPGLERKRAVGFRLALAKCYALLVRLRITTGAVGDRKLTEHKILDAQLRRFMDSHNLKEGSYARLPNDDHYLADVQYAYNRGKFMYTLAARRKNLFRKRAIALTKLYNEHVAPALWNKFAQRPRALAYFRRVPTSFAHFERTIRFFRRWKRSRLVNENIRWISETVIGRYPTSTALAAAVHYVYILAIALERVRTREDGRTVHAALASLVPLVYALLRPGRDDMFLILDCYWPTWTYPCGYGNSMLCTPAVAQLSIHEQQQTSFHGLGKLFYKSLPFKSVGRCFEKITQQLIVVNIRQKPHELLRIFRNAVLSLLFNNTDYGATLPRFHALVWAWHFAKKHCDSLLAFYNFCGSEVHPRSAINYTLRYAFKVYFYTLVHPSAFEVMLPNINYNRSVKNLCYCTDTIRYFLARESHVDMTQIIENVSKKINNSLPPVTKKTFPEFVAQHAHKLKMEIVDKNLLVRELLTAITVTPPRYDVAERTLAVLRRELAAPSSRRRKLVPGTEAIKQIVERFCQRPGALKEVAKLCEEYLKLTGQCERPLSRDRVAAIRKSVWNEEPRGPSMYLSERAMATLGDMLFGYGLGDSSMKLHHILEASFPISDLNSLIEFCIAFQRQRLFVLYPITWRRARGFTRNLGLWFGRRFDAVRMGRVMYTPCCQKIIHWSQTQKKSRGIVYHPASRSLTCCHDAPLKSSDAPTLEWSKRPRKSRYKLLRKRIFSHLRPPEDSRAISIDGLFNTVYVTPFFGRRKVYRFCIHCIVFGEYNFSNDAHGYGGHMCANCAQNDLHRADLNKTCAFCGETIAAAGAAKNMYISVTGRGHDCVGIIMCDKCKYK